MGKWSASQDFKFSEKTTIYERKGNSTFCGNYCKISLISVPRSILIHFMNNWIRPLAEIIFPETEASFKLSPGTIIMIFTLLQPQEECEQLQLLNMTLMTLSMYLCQVKFLGHSIHIRLSIIHPNPEAPSC